MPPLFIARLAMMISRRQFLRGDFSTRQDEATAGDGSRRATIGVACIAFNNIVCRSCADACSEGAIRFAPRVMGSALPLVDGDRCNGCGDCVATCPTSAIALA